MMVPEFLAGYLCEENLETFWHRLLRLVLQEYQLLVHWAPNGLLLFGLVFLLRRHLLLAFFAGLLGLVIALYHWIVLPLLGGHFSVIRDSLFIGYYLWLTSLATLTAAGPWGFAREHRR